MAKSQYSADSSPLPQCPSPFNGNKMGAVTPFSVPATFLKGMLPIPKSYVGTGVNAYIGESHGALRRLTDRASVHRMAEQSGIPTPDSID